MNSMAEQVLVYSSHRNNWETSAGASCACAKFDSNEVKFTFLDGSTLRFAHKGDDFDVYMMDGIRWEEVRVIGGCA